MSETEDNRLHKAGLVRLGLQDIVLAGVILAAFASGLVWDQAERKANIFLLGVILFVFFVAIITLLTYLRYERLGTRPDKITGDLAEEYSRLRGKHNRVLADLWLLFQVLLLIPKGIKLLFKS